MTLTEVFLIILTIGGTALAAYFNHDERKVFICMIVLFMQAIGVVFFSIIKAPEALYWGIAGLEMLCVLLICRAFRLPEWKNEGYLLMVCLLLMASVWNTIFYTYSQHFLLYADMADALAVVTAAWMIGRSDDVLDFARFHLGGLRSVFVN